MQRPINSIIHATASWNETAIQAATQTGQEEIVNYLLQHGADPNPRYGGKTPLTMALELNQPELIEILRSFGGSE
jgi:ankyrin repeat protein